MTERGTRAFKSGKELERSVEQLLNGKGFEVLYYSKWKKTGCLIDEILLKNVPYETIYGENGYMEFLLKSVKHKREIRIECKWQASPGSVDEKLPYLYLNLVEKIPEKEIIVIIEETGMKKGAVPWLKKAVAEKKYTDNHTHKKVIRVMNWDEFSEWAESTF
jgi:hypothetical protein